MMSFSDGLIPLSALTLIKPAACNIFKARPIVVGSFGKAIVAPSGKSLNLLYFLEYKPKGEMTVFPMLTKWAFWLLL